MPPIVLGTLLLILFIYLASALGCRLLRLSRLELADPGENLLLATGLGLGALQAVPFLLFSLGIGHSLAFYALLAVIGILLIPDWIRVWAWFRGWMESLRPTEQWQRIVTMIFGILMGSLYLRSACPATSHDDLSYHVTAAVRFLDTGGFRYLPTLTYTNWPTSVELLFATALALHAESPVSLIQLLLGVVTLGGVYAAARRLGNARAGAASCIALLTYPVFWEEMTVAHVDLGTTAFSILAIFSLLLARQQPDSSARWRTMAAVFGGLAATTKLSGVWVLVSISLLAGGIPAGQQSERGAYSWREALRCLAVGGTVVAPWFIRTWIVTGNPVYPALHSIFGGIEWTAEGWPRVQRYFMLLNSPPGLPPTYANLLLSRLAIIAAAFLILGATLFGTRRSNQAIPARFAALFVALFVIGSAFQLRLVMAAIPAVAVCAGVGLARTRAGAGAALTVIAIALGLYVASSRFFEGQLYASRAALGMVSREDYLRRHLPDYPLVQFANGNLRSTDRILVSTWEEQTALFRPFALRANYWLQDSIHYDSKQRLIEDLRRLKVTHLVHRHLEDEWCAGSKICRGRRDNESRALGRLAAERGIRLGEWNGVTLYELDLDESPAAHSNPQ